MSRTSANEGGGGHYNKITGSCKGITTRLLDVVEGKISFKGITRILEVVRRLQQDYGSCKEITTRLWKF